MSIDPYYDIAMKIHAICFDRNITPDLAKLFVYIYVKSQESNQGVSYFEGDCSIDIDALHIMLDHNMDSVCLSDEENPSIDEVFSCFKVCVNKSIDQTEQRLREIGYENHIYSELRNRLNFHINKDYRNTCLALYEKVISDLNNYDEQKVKLSNLNYQIKIAKEEENLKGLLDE